VLLSLAADAGRHLVFDIVELGRPLIDETDLIAGELTGTASEELTCDDVIAVVTTTRFGGR